MCASVWGRTSCRCSACFKLSRYRCNRRTSPFRSTTRRGHLLRGVSPATGLATTVALASVLGECGHAGGEMGEAFGKGLLGVAGVEGDKLTCAGN